tara:strand:- start:76 stop:297 length:222 start_codon:yes stop_codon:yes gene_type:complete
MEITIKDIFRPIFGFLVLQPMVMIWFMLFTDDWVETYFNDLGWKFQIAMTLWLIPCYAFYERFFVSKEIEMKW